MKVLTHNMLQCHAKNCKTNNFPLRLESCELQSPSQELNPEFLNTMRERIDFSALSKAASELNLEYPIDEQDPESLHRLLFTEIVNGKMICNECGHNYEIINKIPNMLLQENEV